MEKKKSFEWGSFFSKLFAILVIIAKGVIVAAGVAVCVVLWLIGIPVTPRK